MDRHYVIILVVLSVTASCQSFRLPDTLFPSAYDIKLNFPDAIFDGTGTNFTGSVSISFRTTISTNIIQIHSPGSVNDVRVQIMNLIPTSLPVSDTFFNETTEILTITLGENLVDTMSYNLHIDYEANIDAIDRRGVYRSTYSDEMGLRHLITTQFQPIYARKAFPCFDEPMYKATYSLTLSFPFEGLNALSNTIAEHSETSG